MDTEYTWIGETSFEKRPWEDSRHPWAMNSVVRTLGCAVMVADAGAKHSSLGAVAELLSKLWVSVQVWHTGSTFVAEQGFWGGKEQVRGRAAPRSLSAPNQ